MTRTMCDVLLLNSIATNYPTTYKAESVIEILELVFNDHEAELQSEYRKLDGRDFMLSEMQKELKAKNDEIESLQAELEYYYKSEAEDDL